MNLETAKAKWLEFFNNFAIHNNETGELLFHVLVGQCLENAKLQHNNEECGLRINLLVLQPSSTGKGQSIKPLKRICKELGLNFFEYTESTDAGLVGTLSDKKEDNPTGIIKGALGDAEILVFSEGEAVISKGSQFNQNIYQILQNAMDEPGKVAKRLAHGEISYPTDTAIVITSYMTSQFNYALLTKGLIQRVFVIKKNLSDKQISEICERQVRSTSEETKIIELPDELTKFFEGLMTREGTIRTDSEAVDWFLETFGKYRAETLIAVGEDQREILQSFFARFTRLIFKVAAQVAAIDHRFLIEKEDLEYALTLGKIHIGSVIALILSDSDAEYSYFKEKVVELFDEHGRRKYPHGKVALQTHLHNAKLSDIGLNKIGRFIDWMVNDKLLVKEKEEGTPNKYLFYLPTERS